MINKCVYLVRVEIDPSREADWNGWYDSHHLPGVLAEPGFLGARKLKNSEPASDGWSRYVILFDLESRAAFDRYSSSEAAKQLRQEHLDAYGPVTRVQREVLEEVLVATGTRSAL